MRRSTYAGALQVTALRFVANGLARPAPTGARRISSRNQPDPSGIRSTLASDFGPRAIGPQRPGISAGGEVLVRVRGGGIARYRGRDRRRRWISRCGRSMWPLPVPSAGSGSGGTSREPPRRNNGRLSGATTTGRSAGTPADGISARVVPIAFRSGSARSCSQAGLGSRPIGVLQCLPTLSPPGPTPPDHRCREHRR